MSYPSENLIVFPCSNRDTSLSNEKGLKAKLMSEENITNIIKSITDNKSFVISHNGSEMEFVIDGYYFKLSDIPNDRPLYATLNKQQVGNYCVLLEEEEGNFNSLTLSTTVDESKQSDTVISLKLLDVNGDVPNESMNKFGSHSLGITKIDCNGR